MLVVILTQCSIHYHGSFSFPAKIAGTLLVRSVARNIRRMEWHGVRHYIFTTGGKIFGEAYKSKVDDARNNYINYTVQLWNVSRAI